MTLKPPGLRLRQNFGTDTKPRDRVCIGACAFSSLYGKSQYSLAHQEARQPLRAAQGWICPPSADGRLAQQSSEQGQPPPRLLDE